MRAANGQAEGGATEETTAEAEAETKAGTTAETTTKQTKSDETRAFDLVKADEGDAGKTSKVRFLVTFVTEQPQR